MELQYYFNIIYRRKWLITMTALLAALLAFTIISLKKSTYKSEATLSTGVIDYTGINSGKDNPFIQKLQVDMRFNNLLEFVTSRRCINLLTFHLLTHDLQPEEFGTQSFRTPDLSTFSKEKLADLNYLLVNKLNDLKPEFENPSDELFFNKVAKAYGYDYESLKEDNLEVWRKGETDYVLFSFKSENPELSAFAASKFSNSFIDYFESLRKGEEEETLQYLTKSAKEKKDILVEKQGILENYKNQKQLVDLEAQRGATINQIKELEQDKNDALKTINANRKTIANLDNLLNERGSSGVKKAPNSQEATALLTNRKILNLRRQERELINKLIDGQGNKKKNEDMLKSIKSKLDKEIKALSKIYKGDQNVALELDDQTITNELFEKQVDATIELTDAKEVVEVINKKLEELRIRAKSYVSDEAFLLNLEREIDIAKKEYEEIVAELSKEKLSTKRENSPLTIIEHAQLPEEAEADNKFLFTAFSGTIGGALATFLIFILSFFDNSLQSANQFKVVTNLPLVGRVPKVRLDNLNLQTLFSGPSSNSKLEQFKELVRSLRYNVEQMERGKVLLFTSSREDVGKSFLITLIAHTFSLKHKRVVLIDTNFKRNTLSTWATGPTNVNPVLHQLLVGSRLSNHFAITTLSSPFHNNNIDLISNSGRFQSLLERVEAEEFKQFLRGLANLYDYIILEGAALNNYTDTKELVDFSDQVISVFRADTSLSPKDEESISFLRGLDKKLAGAVLNKVDWKNLNA